MPLYAWFMIVFDIVLLSYVAAGVIGRQMLKDGKIDIPALSKTNTVVMKSLYTVMYAGAVYFLFFASKDTQWLPICAMYTVVVISAVITFWTGPIFLQKHDQKYEAAEHMDAEFRLNFNAVSIAIVTLTALYLTYGDTISRIPFPWVL